MIVVKSSFSNLTSLLSSFTITPCSVYLSLTFNSIVLFPLSEAVISFFIVDKSTFTSTPSLALAVKFV